VEIQLSGSAQQWGFAIYRASHDDHQDSFVPTGPRAAHPKTPSTPPAVLADPTRLW
jgi:hypothetical protein